MIKRSPFFIAAICFSFTLVGCAQVSPIVEADLSSTARSVDGASPTPSDSSLSAPASNAEIHWNRETGMEGLVAQGFVDSATSDLWSTRIQTLTSLLPQIQLGDLSADWDGNISVMIPATAEEFTVGTGRDAQTFEAATVCVGASSVIYVSPAISQVDPEEVDVMLLHETVHVLTNSPCAEPGPQWVSEGIAESVTASAYSFVAGENEELIYNYLLENPIPKALPDLTASFTPPALGVALSQVAVDAAIEKWGREKALNVLGAIATLDPAATGKAQKSAQKNLKTLTKLYISAVEKLK